jgi:hypothetical protein
VVRAAELEFLVVLSADGVHPVEMGVVFAVAEF